MVIAWSGKAPCSLEVYRGVRLPHVAQAITLPVTQRKYAGKVKIKEVNE
jgi:hypothetical protein